MAQAKFRFDFRSDGYGVSPPCTSMEEISYEYEESAFKPSPPIWRKGTFKIAIFISNRYFKDITQTKYVSFKIFKKISSLSHKRILNI